MKKLILDSSRSSNRNLNTPKWVLSEPISCNKIRYNSIILPLSFDIIHNENNTLSFGVGSFVKQITLDTGVYTPDDLVTELERKMNEIASQTYNVEYSNLTGKLTFSAATPFQLFSNGSLLSKVLGLTGDTALNAVVELQNPIDLTGTKMILVASTSLRSTDVILAGEEGLNVIATIPISQETGTVLCSQNYFDTDFIDTESGLVSAIDITLLDSETLKPINLNGKGFTIVLDCHSSGFMNDE